MLGVMLPLVAAPKPKELVEGVLRRHSCIERRGHSTRMFGDQVIRQLIVFFQFNLRKNLQANQPGGSGEVADRNCGDKHQSTFGRNAERIAPKRKSSIVPSESGFESLEFVAKSVTLAATPGSSGPWEPGRGARFPRRGPRIRKA